MVKNKKQSPQESAVESEQTQTAQDVQPPQAKDAKQEDAAQTKDAAQAQPDEQAQDVQPHSDEQTQDVQAALDAMAELIKQRDEYLGMAQRLQAEFENYKRRNATLRTDAFCEGKAQCIEALLPVLDDLERALSAAEDASDALAQGVRLVVKNMLAILETMDVTPIQAVGEDFDPQLHEAILQQPVEDAAQKGKVITEVRRGYRMQDKVLRYAMVVVGQ